VAKAIFCGKFTVVFLMKKEELAVTPSKLSGVKCKANQLVKWLVQFKTINRKVLFRQNVRLNEKKKVNEKLSKAQN